MVWPFGASSTPEEVKPTHVVTRRHFTIANPDAPVDTTTDNLPFFLRPFVDPEEQRYNRERQSFNHLFLFNERFYGPAMVCGILGMPFYAVTTRWLPKKIGNARTFGAIALSMIGCTYYVANLSGYMKERHDDLQDVNARILERPWRAAAALCGMVWCTAALLDVRHAHRLTAPDTPQSSFLVANWGHPVGLLPSPCTFHLPPQINTYWCLPFMFAGGSVGLWSEMSIFREIFGMEKPKPTEIPRYR